MDSDRDRQIARAALYWYRKHQRLLPWRQTRDLYAIWVSEIMLQQTQVATVIPYFERFLIRFPDPAALAEASDEEVYRLWAGLGYYRRARQLHAAAKKIVEQHAGEFPHRLEDVLALPGIGRYTAHAILSFALDARLGIVEANTQRLYARLLHWEGPTESSEAQRAIWKFANAIVPVKHCGDFNQAVMEIGSQICTPRNPACDQCPLFRFCPTGQRGHADRIPAPKPKKAYTERTEAVVLVQNTSAQWLVRRCAESERWAGLWDFPRFDISDCPKPLDVARRLRQSMLDQFHIEIELTDSKFSLRHSITRYRIHLLCFLGELQSEAKGIARRATDAEQLRWLDIDELDELAWNASGKRILKWLQGLSRPDAKSRPSVQRDPSSTRIRRNAERRN